MENQDLTSLYAYLAGYFDGEGCICFRKDKTHPNPNLYLSLHSGDREVLELFAQTFGGTLSKPYKPAANSRRAITKWYRYGEEAQKVLKALLPYLRSAKKEEAELVLQIVIGKQGKKSSPEEIKKRREIAERVSAINNRVDAA